MQGMSGHLNRRAWMALASALGAGTARAQRPPLRAAWDDYPPYQLGDAHGGPQGLDVRITEAVLEHAGCAVEWRRMPWARQLLSLQDGSLDLVLSASKLAEREAYALWTEPYRPERGALLALQAPARPLSHLRELAAQPRVRIGMIRGTAFPGEFLEARAQAGFTERLVPLRHVEQGVRLLRQGRIDYLIDDPVPAQHLARAHGMPPLVVVRLLYQGSARLMLAKAALTAHPGLLARLDAGIGQLRDSGALRQHWASVPGLDG